VREREVLLEALRLQEELRKSITASVVMDAEGFEELLTLVKKGTALLCELTEHGEE